MLNDEFAVYVCVCLCCVCKIFRVRVYRAHMVIFFFSVSYHIPKRLGDFAYKKPSTPTHPHKTNKYWRALIHSHTDTHTFSNVIMATKFSFAKMVPINRNVTRRHLSNLFWNTLFKNILSCVNQTLNYPF